MIINDGNFKLIAAKLYNNIDFLDEEDFRKDLSIISNIKKLFSRYKKDKSKLKLKLILNHFITFFNVFSPVDIASRLLIFKFKDELDILKPFLLSLGYWSEENLLLQYPKEVKIVVMDKFIIESLRKEHHDRSNY